MFNQAWSLDFRTGGIRSNPATDNDLVVGGCTIDKVPGYEFETATVHTGPGDDWIFARDMRAAAIDAGNGANGNTSYIDPYDGDDWVMLHGYMKDIRVFGGAGDDVVFWHLDEMVDADISFFGPNFFGEGGAGNAIWAEGGTDRMVFGVSPDTLIVDAMPTPPGGMLVRIWDGDTDEIWWDEPVYDDPFARYCITCGTSDTGRKTMNLEYLSPDGTIFTGWFWVTNFEEFQFGVGTDARVYRVDDVHGVLVEAPDLKPILPPEYPYWYCAAPLHPAWPNADAVDVYEAP
ncbi:MAG: hypothetical protein H6816_16095 [Phycisphaerales bacterium]|nr:hypothetical protein [Phycisphaerales bacterium]